MRWVNNSVLVTATGELLATLATLRAKLSVTRSSPTIHLAPAIGPGLAAIDDQVVVELIRAILTVVEVGADNDVAIGGAVGGFVAQRQRPRLVSHHLWLARVVSVLE